MPNINPIYFITFALIAACNNSTGNSTPMKDSVISSTTADVSPVQIPADTVLSGCYSLINNKDTAFLQLEVKGKTAAGTLTYNFYQKDRNDGSFQGEVNGNLLTGWYLFKSEGVMSVRQVTWKVDGGHLLPGLGESIQRNDSLLFRQPDKLRFDDKKVFVKVKCLV